MVLWQILSISNTARLKSQKRKVKSKYMLLLTLFCMLCQSNENFSPNWMLLTFAFLSLQGWALAVNMEPDPDLIDIGKKECNDAHSLCPKGYDLPVIRTKEELDRIYAHHGNTSK